MEYTWNLIKQVLLLTLGGFIGAVFGLVAGYKMEWIVAIALIVMYSILIMVVIFVIDYFMKKIPNKHLTKRDKLNLIKILQESMK